MTAPLPERVTMPLLALIAQGAVDEDYAQAARRRVAVGTPATARSRHTVAAAGVAVFGLLIAVAAVQTSRNADVDSASRALLTERIDARKAGVADQQRQIRALRRDNADEQAATGRLDGTLRGAQDQLRDLQVLTGFAAVTGPGLQVTVDDAPDGAADGRVRASDLRLLVDALWQAGAEAVAINNRRLTTLSSIVNANIAVQVNRGPISPPYVVTAVGDPEALDRTLAGTSTGRSFTALADEFGFLVLPGRESRLQLPAAPPSQLPLRYARPADQGPGDQGPADQGPGDQGSGDRDEPTS